MGVDACIEVRGVNLTDEDIRQCAGDLAECIGAENFWIKPEEGQHCLSRTDEGNIVVNTFWRYYGPGYERGPWMEIRYTLLWLMQRFQGGKVYYCGDNVDFNEPVTIEFLTAMDEHFLSRGHEPYNSYFKRIFDNKKQRCDFCLRYMANHGGGGTFEFLICHGCDRKWIYDLGKLILIEKEDFFTASKRLREEKANAID